MRSAWVGALALGVALSGCTSVKMVQRDDCWVRRTEKWYGAVQEELGPCARPAQALASDRQTRLIQECVAQADHRWQTQALHAFSRGLPFPSQDSQQKVLELCMAEASRSYVTENEELKTRLAEAQAQQDELKGALARNEDHLRESNARLTEFLGEAAQKPPGSATATATASSDGKATTENSSKREESRQESPAVAPAPAITWVTTQAAPACNQQPSAKAPKPRATQAAPSAPACSPAGPTAAEASDKVASTRVPEPDPTRQERFPMEGPIEQEKLLP